LALAAGLTVTVNAQMVYTWVPYSGNGTPTSGTLTITGGSVSSLTFVDGSYGTYSTALGSTWSPFSGSGVTVLAGDNDAVLSGLFINANPTLDQLAFLPNGGNTPGAEQNVEDFYNSQGNWVPVPEPTTVVAGMLLLLPFGASTVRALRKSRTA